MLCTFVSYQRRLLHLARYYPTYKFCIYFSSTTTTNITTPPPFLFHTTSLQSWRQLFKRTKLWPCLSCPNTAKIMQTYERIRERTTVISILDMPTFVLQFKQMSCPDRLDEAAVLLFSPRPAEEHHPKLPIRITTPSWKVQWVMLDMQCEANKCNSLLWSICHNSKSFNHFINEAIRFKICIENSPN